MQHSRIARVAELVKEVLGEILDQELKNPKIPSFITVHSVKVAKELRHADVYVTLLADDEAEKVEEVVSELNGAAGFIRGALGRRIRLKRLPELRFHYNPSTRYAARLESLLSQLEPQPTEERSEGRRQEP